MVSIFNQVILFVFYLCGVTAFKWIDCGSRFKILDIKLGGCDNSRCTMFKGSKYTAELLAVATSPTSKLNYKVETVDLFPITLTEGDGCPDLKMGKCNLTNGNKFLFKTEFEIPAIIPTSRVQIKTVVRDNLNRMIMCGEVNVKVKHPPHLAFLDVLDFDP